MGAAIAFYRGRQCVFLCLLLHYRSFHFLSCQGAGKDWALEGKNVTLSQMFPQNYGCLSLLSLLRKTFLLSAVAAASYVCRADRSESDMIFSCTKCAMGKYIWLLFLLQQKDRGKVRCGLGAKSLDVRD